MEMSRTKAVAIITAIFLTLFGGVLGEFWFWKKVHPQAPAWTFFFHK